MEGKAYPEDRSRRDDPIGPVGQAIAAARELLDVEVVCVSRILNADERRFEPTLAHPPESLPDDTVTMPLESGEGRLYGSLVCRSRDEERPLDERDARFLRVVGRLIGAQIERDERELARRRSGAENAGLQALLAAVEARDRYTGEHSRSVVNLSVRVGRELGLTEGEVEQVEQVALLHDVGKVAVADAILHKPGPLDEDEWQIVRRHSAIGARIVASIGGLAHLAPAIRSGHERWDGRGYPDGLRGEEIPIPSRITSVCDAWDAMVSDRPYRNALGLREARDELARNVGTQFCPRAGGALLAVVGRASTSAMPVRARSTTSR